MTLSGSINYLRSAAHAKMLTAICREVKVGGHVGFFEVNITDEEERLIARAEVNMYFLQE